ncbi:hypothetical protein M6B38_128680 [Iris pallida]|uniref:Uncharacterized protein n=1 Tax=Iris pallida TaxID=29817 RepID=A0AAX6FY32_IRIPA|nr:hypothetical protein M6B38_393580 [Iris pallida]KAJ6823635.1 hypothetical protein M6B38_128680 [Iris pallida]
MFHLHGLNRPFSVVRSTDLLPANPRRRWLTANGPPPAYE